MRPRIYVADLAAYNYGRLHGRWIDCDQAPEEIAAQIREMLSESPVAGADEWRIDDAEGFGSWHIGEWESCETLAAVAQLLVAHGDALSAFVANEGMGYWSKRPDELESAFTESYSGCWESVTDYAAQFIEDCYDLTLMGPLADYIDYASFARDLVLGGDVWTADAPAGRVHVFRAS